MYSQHVLPGLMSHGFGKGWFDVLWSIYPFFLPGCLVEESDCRVGMPVVAPFV